VSNFTIPTLAIPATVFPIMVCLGLELTIADFKRILVFPRAVATGIAGQMLLLPAAAFLIAATLAESLVLQIGIVLLAACPGGPLSTSLVYFTRAKVELSVSLTAVNGVLALFTTPFIAALGISLFAGEQANIELPIGKTVAQIFTIAVLPVGIGMWLRSRWFERVQRHTQGIKRFALVMFLLHVSIVVLANLPLIGPSAKEMLLPAIVFCMCAQTIGYCTAAVARLDREERFTIGMEIGLQNVTLAILIANTVLEPPEFGLFVLNYALGAVLVLFPWIYIYRWRTARLALQGAV
jgi:BASS family bile acid:Na+ symporter